MSDQVVLNSWKEISQYMGRSVRTLQRWERYGLPVHRPSGRDKSSVYALPHELKQWLEKGKPKEPVDKEYEDRLHAIMDRAHNVADSMEQLRKNTHTLQERLQRSMELRDLYRSRRGNNGHWQKLSA
jgi:phage terminase Nu1 subunit (DNA packaging protein)